MPQILGSCRGHLWEKFGGEGIWQKCWGSAEGEICHLFPISPPLGNLGHWKYFSQQSLKGDMFKHNFSLLTLMKNEYKCFKSFLFAPRFLGFPFYSSPYAEPISCINVFSAPDYQGINSVAYVRVCSSKFSPSITINCQTKNYSTFYISLIFVLIGAIFFTMVYRRPCNAC